MRLAIGDDRLVDAYLQTERLTLRRFTDDDVDLLVELDSDPAVMRFLTGGEPTPSEVIRDRQLPGILNGYETWGGELGLFAAHETVAGAFIGWFMLRPEADGPPDEAELGYRLRRSAWGKGYATEGSQALLTKAFVHVGLRLVWADTMSVNTRSRHVMEKLDMALVGDIPVPLDMLVIEGSELGGVRHQITAEDWQGRRGPADRAG